jgi:AraC-like DNA-binding protein
VRESVKRRPGFPALPQYGLPFYPRSAGTQIFNPGEDEICDGSIKPFVQITLVTGGAGTMLSEGVVQPVNPGDIIIKYPFEARENKVTGQYLRLYWLTFDGDNAEIFAASYGKRRIFNAFGTKIEHFFVDFKACLADGRRKAMRQAVNIVSELLGKIWDFSEYDEQYPPIMKQFFNTVEKHFANPEININMICDILNVNRSTLTRAFIASAGQFESPGSYLRQVRIEAALKLLRNSSIEINSAAKQCGFANPARFTRLVKAQTGFTPREIRKIQQ